MADPLAGSPYRTIRPIGGGGMGHVVEAEHVALGRRVVVKVLHANLVARSEAADRARLTDRMRLEGQALAAIEHPNVVAALDCGVTQDGRPYLVMERLVGRTLREEIEARAPLPAAEAIEIAAQALDGLEAIHARGIVHRDLKPENIFVCDAQPGRPRTVKLLDLGVAKLVAPSSAGVRPLLVPTADGIAMGTPRFFSPEQATGAALDARSDLYSMGVVLYAMLTGRTPFEHIEKLSALLRALAEEHPLPLSRATLSRPAAERVSPALEAAVEKALAKRPDDRFASARAFADELRRIAAERRPTTGALAALFVAVLAAGFVLALAVTTLVLALAG